MLMGASHSGTATGKAVAFKLPGNGDMGDDLGTASGGAYFEVSHIGTGQ
jgi:hypothetical protein